MGKIKTGGKLRGRIFAAWPENFLNAAAAQGTELFNVESLGKNSVRFEAGEKSLDELILLAEKCSAEFEYTSCRDRGRELVKSRALLLVFSALFGMLLMLSSLFIWQIEIHGLSPMEQGKLLRALEDSGLSCGSFWPGLSMEDIRSRCMLKMPELGWMSVNISGSRAMVLVREREEKPEIYDETSAADLVAAKSGIVRRVSALCGKALVSPGQAVTKGESLVSGRLESIKGESRFVRARGSVMAETWTEISAVCPEQENIKTDSGLRRHRFALVIGKRRINFYISSGKAIDECDKIIKEYTLGIEGHFALPLRLVHESILPYDTAAGKAYDAAAMERDLIALLESGTEGQILGTSFTEALSGGLYVLTLRAHCMENIALTQEMESLAVTKGTP